MNRYAHLSLRRGSNASWLLALSFLSRLANAASWVPIGPGAFWFNESVRSLTVQAGSPGTVWLGMPHGALYRSRNRGSSWTWVG